MCLFRREMRVGLLHPVDRLLDGGVAARDAAGELPHLLHPFDDALVRRRLRLGGDLVRRPAQAFYRHRLHHRLREEAGVAQGDRAAERMARSEEHTSELQSLMRISYAVSCLTKKNT